MIPYQPLMLLRLALLCFALLLGQQPSTAFTAYSECDRFTGTASYGTARCEKPLPMGLNGTLRVAVAQTSSNSTHTLEENTAMVIDFVRRAGAARARVVVFPELVLTGYFTGAVAALAQQPGGAAAANARLRIAEDAVAAACRDASLYCFVGVPVFFANITTAAPRPWYNTVLVIDPDGKKIYRQAKLYPCCPQDGAAGTWLDVITITTGGDHDVSVPVGINICYDDYHPEVARLLAMKGAQVIMYSSWESDVSLEWKLSLSATRGGSAQGVVSGLAATNEVFVVQANAGARVDTMASEATRGYGGHEVEGGCHGQSSVVSPTGEVLEQARVFGRQLLVHDLDLRECGRQADRMVRESQESRVFAGMWAEGLKQVGAHNRMPVENDEVR